MDTNVIGQVQAALHTELFGTWKLIAAAMVFFMQCGFAMIEAGFIRAKNAGNIIMKNLMDFCIGTVVFMVVGFGFLSGENALFGLIGAPDLQMFSDYGNFDWSNFIFNLMFCAATASIVSGAMAERTKFIGYCAYSVIISAVIYPIEAHWVWGGGWLAKLGYHDFAGSTPIHMVGGLTALIGAAMLGARLGKFEKDSGGKVIKVKAIPGHSVTLGALGAFILWFGWYGFNGGGATSVSQLATILVATTVSPSVATIVCMIFTWAKYGKPDISMCLNASLAGLVAVTGACDCVTGLGAAAIGTVSGVLIIFGVWFLDHVLHVDDPVGAAPVHLFNGIWGGIAIGLFSTKTAPDSTVTGLFYGGGFHQLGIQLTGMAAIFAWTGVTAFGMFYLIKKLFGLRVSPQDELSGLDASQHGLASCYADFMPAVGAMSDYRIMENDTDEVPMSAAIPVELMGSGLPQADKISKVSIICKQSKFENLKAALNDIGVTGITVTQVLGCGTQKGRTDYYRGVEVEMNLLPKIKVEVVVSMVPVARVVSAAKKALYTGNIGDGKIFIYDVEEVVRVRTGETGVSALN
ncbi:MAG: ammonium transporter [Oscillospiraceae bacterium]